MVKHRFHAKFRKQQVAVIYGELGVVSKLTDTNDCTLMLSFATCLGEGVGPVHLTAHNRTQCRSQKEAVRSARFPTQAGSG